MAKLPGLSYRRGLFRGDHTRAALNAFLASAASPRPGRCHTAYFQRRADRTLEQLAVSSSKRLRDLELSFPLGRLNLTPALHADGSALRRRLHRKTPILSKAKVTPAYFTTQNLLSAPTVRAAELVTGPVPPANETKAQRDV